MIVAPYKTRIISITWICDSFHGAHGALRSKYSWGAPYFIIPGAHDAPYTIADLSLSGAHGAPYKTRIISITWICDSFHGAHGALRSKYSWGAPYLIIPGAQGAPYNICVVLITVGCAMRTKCYQQNPH